LQSTQIPGAIEQYWSPVFHDGRFMSVAPILKSKHSLKKLSVAALDSSNTPTKLNSKRISLPPINSPRVEV